MAHINGQPWGQQYGFNESILANITPWVSSYPYLPEAISGASIVLIKNRVHLLGGSNSMGRISTTYSAPVNTDGTLGTWAASGNLPGILSRSVVFATSTRVYLCGGFGSAFTAAVYTAPINADGTLGTWTTGNSLPGPLSGTCVAVTLDRVYLLGGRSASTTYTSVIYTAPINVDGTIGTWTTSGNIPVKLYGASIAVTNSRIYLLGGYNSGGALNAVYTAPINVDGTLGAWTNGTSLPEAVFEASVAVIHNRVFLMGGVTSLDTILYTAPVNTDGTLGTWAAGAYLPSWTSESSLVVTSSKIFMFGGLSSGFSQKDIVWYADFTGGLNDYTGKLTDNPEVPADPVIGIVEFTPSIPKIYGFSEFVNVCSFIPPQLSIIATGAIAIIGTLRVKPLRVVCNGLGYAGELIAQGHFSPPLHGVSGQGTVSIYGTGNFRSKVPVVQGNGEVPVPVQVITGIGNYSPPLPIISGWSIPPVTGAARFSPPMVRIDGHGLRSCYGTGAFAPRLPLIKGAGSAGLWNQGVLSFPTDQASSILPTSVPSLSNILEFDRDSVAIGVLSTPPINITPLSFSR